MQGSFFVSIIGLGASKTPRCESFWNFSVIPPISQSHSRANFSFFNDYGTIQMRIIGASRSCAWPTVGLLKNNSWNVKFCSVKDRFKSTKWSTHRQFLAYIPWKNGDPQSGQVIESWLYRYPHQHKLLYASFGKIQWCVGPEKDRLLFIHCVLLRWCILRNGLRSLRHGMLRELTGQ